VDVRAFEPLTPCLQRRERKSISLVRLASFCVVLSDFEAILAAFGPKLDLSFLIENCLVIRSIASQ
jgi:hypothetical protein